jgi:hypothetical protein
MRRVTRMVAAMVMVTVLVVGSVAFAEAQEQVPLCHNGHTIMVGAPAKEVHLNHGDSPEPCGEQTTG